MIDRIFRSVKVKEQGFNAALSVLHLSSHYSNQRFEDACQIVLTNTTLPRYKYLKVILASNQDILLRQQKDIPAHPGHRIQKTSIRAPLSVGAATTEEVITMISDETRRKLREMQLEPMAIPMR